MTRKKEVRGREIERLVRSKLALMRKNVFVIMLAFAILSVMLVVLSQGDDNITGNLSLGGNLTLDGNVTDFTGLDYGSSGAGNNFSLGDGNLTDLGSGGYDIMGDGGYSIQDYGIQWSDDGTTAQSVTDCNELNTTNGVYTLANNVTANGTCFTIKANNITIDGSGYTINYSANGTIGYGIYSRLSNSTVVMNMTVIEGRSTGAFYNRAIYYNASSNGTIRNNRIIATGYGIHLWPNSNFNTINNNTVTSSSYTAIYVQSSSNITITNNMINESTQGIYIVTGSNIGISFNTINVSKNNAYEIYGNPLTYSNISFNTATMYGTGSIGVYLTSGSNSNTINNNTITMYGTGTTYGIYISASANNTLMGNWVNTSYVNSYSVSGTSRGHYNQSIDSSNLAEGKPVNYTFNASGLVFDGVDFTQYGEVMFAYSRNITIKNSNFSDDSLNLLWTNSSLIENNTIITNNSFGIFLSSNSKFNRLNNNTIKTNGSYLYGIYFSDSSASSNNMSNNVIITNASYGHGIFLSSGSNLLDSNTIAANGLGAEGLHFASASSNIINNNTIYTNGSSAYGIYLTSSNSNTFNNNSVTTYNANAAGIYLSSGSSNTLNNNNITTYGSSGYGIWLTSDSSSNITLNTITTSQSTAYGIYLQSSSGANVTLNTIRTSGSSAGYGLALDSSSTFNTFAKNTIINNGTSGYGILLSSSNSNTFNNNTFIISGSSAHGAYIFSSSNSNISSNIFYVSGSNAYGMWIITSNSNKFNNNTIMTNGTSGHGIYLQSSSNANSFSGMNIRTNSTGSYGIYIVNTNHNFTITDSVINSSVSDVREVYVAGAVVGGMWNFTNVTKFDGATPVVFNWTKGANGTLNMMWYLDAYANYSNSSIASGVNISGQDLNSVQRFSVLTGDDGNIPRQTLVEYTRNSTSGTNFTFYSNYTVNATTLSEVLSKSVNLSINKYIVFNLVGDATPPNGTLLLPANNSYLNYLAVNFTANLTDNSGLKNATLNVYFSNGTLVNQTTTTFAGGVVSTVIGTVVTLVDGVYKWFYSLFDTSENQYTTENYTLTVDTLYPSINYGDGTLGDGVNVSRLNIYVNISANDTYETNVTFSLFNLAGAVNVTTYNAGNRTINWTGLNDGIYYYNVTVVDLASNSNTTATRTITLDITAPNGSLLAPVNNSYLNYSAVNFTVNLTDNLGVKNATLNVYFSNGTLVNQTTTTFAGGVVSTVIGTVVTLVDGMYKWFYSLFDFAGNIFTTGNNTVTVDTTLPTINFTSPSDTNGSYLSRNYILINVSSTDTNLANLTINLYNSTALVNSTITTTSPNYVNISGLANGQYWFNATSIDLANNKNNTETRTVTLDTANPSINFTNPTETAGNYISRNNIIINVTSTDTNLANITIRLYNSTGIYNTTTTTTSLNYVNITNLLDGVYWFNASAYDSANNKNESLTRNVTVDTTNPLVDYGLGTLGDGVNVSQSNVYVNVSVTEINEANITFRLYNTTSAVNVTTYTTAVRGINWTLLPDTRYTYNVTVVDLASNSNTTATRTITLDITAPNGTLLLPSNNSYLNYSSNINFTANLSDNSGLKNATLNVYFSNGTLVNQTTTTFAGGVVSTVIGTVVTLVDGMYKWFYSLFDFAGNIFTTGNNTLNADTTFPVVNFTYPTPGNYFRASSFDINVSIFELNLANVSYNWNGAVTVYDTTSNMLTNLGSGYWSFNLTQTGLSAGVNYSYNVTVKDFAGNVNISETKNITGNTVPGFSSIINSPNISAGIDPYAVITLTANVSDIDSNFDSAILQWRNSTAVSWTNVSMENLTAKGLYTFMNISFTLPVYEGNITYRIWANDTQAGTNYSVNYTLQSFWDCTWESTVDLGAAVGWDINKWVGNITINNTGDSAYATSNCSLDFRVSYDLAEGRIYYDGEYVKNVMYYTIAAKGNQNISINATFGTEVKSENAVITINEFRGRSNMSKNNVSLTVVSNQNGPYLYQKMTTYPANVYLTAGNFSLNGYIRNLMGSATPNDNNTAYNVSFYWTLPSGFTNVSGNLTITYVNLSDNSLNYNPVYAGFSSLATMSSGAQTFILSSYGYNITNGKILDANGYNNLSERVNITFLCYSTADGVYVTACGSLDGDYVAPVTATNATTTSGGGGGGGGAGEPNVYERYFTEEDRFELVRGKQSEFVIEFRNPYTSGELRNLDLKLSGMLSEYIDIEPKAIDEIGAKERVKILATISAPSYFNEGSYELKLSIDGDYVSEDDITEGFSAEKRITLRIYEISREEAEGEISESERFVKELKNGNLSYDLVEKLLEQMKKEFDESNYGKVNSKYLEAQEYYNNAFESMKLIAEVNGLIAQAEKDGLKVSETKKIVGLAESAFSRGDYALALERIKEAQLSYALEVKGEFNLPYYVKNHPVKSGGAAAALAVMVMGSSLLARRVLLKKKLRILSEEEKLLIGLMKVVQRECFEEARMSMDEYESTMTQYEDRLNKVIQEKIGTETKITHLFRLRGGKREALKEEMARLKKMMIDTQKLYFERSGIETRIYENMMRSYASKLSEVEENLVTLEAQEALSRKGLKWRGGK